MCEAETRLRHFSRSINGTEGDGSRHCFKTSHQHPWVRVHRMLAAYLRSAPPLFVASDPAIAQVLVGDRPHKPASGKSSSGAVGFHTGHRKG